MRGLNTRVAQRMLEFSQYLIQPPQMTQEVIHFMAVCDGLNDFKDGVYTPPVQFQNEPFLLNGWKNGQLDAAEIDEMENCSGCQDGRVRSMQHAWLTVSAQSKKIDKG